MNGQAAFDLQHQWRFAKSAMMKRLAHLDSQADEGSGFHFFGPETVARSGRDDRDTDIGSVPTRNEQLYRRMGHGYASRRRDPKALVLTIGLHAAAIAALASAGYSAMDRSPSPTLEVFNLQEPEVSPPPPPPKQELALPEQVEIVHKVVAPPAKFDMPSPNPVQTTREPPPEPKATAVAVETPSLSAGPPAPPAPIVPPNFNAAQLNNPAPSYPYLSKKAKEQGVVMLKVRVGTSGRAKAVNLHRSSGFDRLDAAALKTVKRWRFVAATQAGEAIEAWVLVPVTFALN